MTNSSGLAGLWHDISQGLARLREKNFALDTRSRAVWVSEEAASEEFRWLWQDGEFDDLKRVVSRLHFDANKCPVDSKMEAPYGWHVDSVGGVLREAPARSSRGDLLDLLEPARLQDTSMLAAFGAFSGDRDAGDRALELISDFDIQCPYPFGIHWEYLDEVAVRLVSLTWVRALLGWAHVDEQVGDGLLELVYLHQRYLARFMQSAPTPDGRHLAAAAAQLVAGLAFPGFPESSGWRDDAAEFFEEQVLAQTYKDGVGLEQNTAVEERTLELCLLVLRLARAWDYPILPEVSERIEAMCHYFIASHAARDPAGRDGDHGAGLGYSLPLGESHRSRSLAAVAAVHFDRPEWARFSGMLDPQAVLLIGDLEELDRFDDWTDVTQVERFLPGEVFPTGGKFYFRSNRGPALTLGFDASRMGLAPHAPGAHADSLGLSIELNGQPLVVDPGSLPARDDEGYYDYFRSTGAHSTVRLNWEDSATPEYGGMWSAPTSIRDLGYATTTGGRLVMARASHEAYSRDGRRVTHTRMVVRDSGDSYHLAIEDRIEAEGDGELEYELLFHLDPAVAAIQKQRDLYQVRLGESMLSLRFSSDNPIEIGATKGHVAPLLGWAARDGREKKEIWVLRVHGKDKAPVVIRTALFPGPAPT